MVLFKDSRVLSKDLLERCKMLLNGKSMTEACIAVSCITSHDLIVERVDRDGRNGRTMYPYEYCPSVQAFALAKLLLPSLEN